LPPQYYQASPEVTYSTIGETLGTHYLPSVGESKLLVIPISFTDYSSSATEARLQDIRDCFFGSAEETGWQSLSSYYETSSYHQLHLSGTVTSWYDSKMTTSDLKGTSTEINSSGILTLTQAALNWYKITYATDGSEFDTNHDGFIDGIWFVYGCPNYSHGGPNSSTFWAFTSWQNNTASVTSPVIDTFGWASYDFLYEGYGSKVDAHTFIHETGHMMGLADYYDYSYTTSPMGGIDMMDYNIIDHDAYSKFALGWVSPYVADGSFTLTLHSFADTGECLILPSGRGFHGVFDEYLLIEFFTPTGVNAKDCASAYPGNGLQGFSKPGVRIYHVDARMCTASKIGRAIDYTSEVVNTETMGTTLANSNTVNGNALNSGVANEFRLIQELDHTAKRNFAKLNERASNASLWGNNSSFELTDYENAFPQYYYENAHKTRLNDGSSLYYSCSFSEMTSTSVVVDVSED
jgi:M6 family metalloprotease-like protein